MGWESYRQVIELEESEDLGPWLDGLLNADPSVSEKCLFSIPDAPMEKTGWDQLLFVREARRRGLTLLLHVKTRGHSLQSLANHIYNMKSQHGIQHFLLVSGDDVQVGELTSREALEYLKQDHPFLMREAHFAVALDPQSSSAEKEEFRLEQKLANGASAVFTQPVLLHEDLERVRELLPRSFPVFYGVCSLARMKAWPKYWAERCAQKPALEGLSDFSVKVLQSSLKEQGKRFWMSQSELGNGVDQEIFSGLSGLR